MLNGTLILVPVIHRTTEVYVAAGSRPVSVAWVAFTPSRSPLVAITPVVASGAPTASTLYPVTGSAVGTEATGFHLTSAVAPVRTTEAEPAGACWPAGPAGQPP